MTAVDILMPTFNPEIPLLERAISSIIYQSHPNWHLFIVQDGGDCDLSQLKETFQDPRIHFFERPHQGKAATLNFALAQGDSRYIAYLDDDDIWYPEHLKVCLGAMTETRARFVYTDAYQAIVEKEEDSYVKKAGTVLSKGLLTDITLWQISHINAVHERKLLEEAGSYDVDRQFFIDWDMFLRMAKISKPVHCQIFTCEHYLYPRRAAKEGTISGIHAKDPALSEKAFSEMVARAYDILDAEGFVKIVLDLKWRDEYRDKTGKEFIELEYLKQTIQEQSETIQKQAETIREQSEAIQKHLEIIEKQQVELEAANQKRNDMLQSFSWKLSKPVRLFGQLLGMPQPPEDATPHAADQAAPVAPPSVVRPRLLFIAPRLPEFDRASGDLRLYRILQILSQSYNIYYFNDGMWERFLKNGEKKYLSALNDLGINVLETEEELADSLSENPTISVIAEFYHLGSKYYNLVKKHAPEAFFIIDSVDIHFLRERLMAETLGDEQLRLNAEVTKEDELKAYMLAGSIWTVSTLDQKVLSECGIPNDQIKIVPNIHTLPRTVSSLEKRERNTLLFVGGFAHQPNVDAMRYFCSEIFPLIKRRIPDTKLLIVGDSPPTDIQKLATDDIAVLGYVPDTSPFLNSANVSIAPLRYGAGLKGKVGEALAAGLPLVTTSIGVQGMEVTSGKECFIADTAENFADCVVKLLEDPGLWHTFSSNGRTYMQDHYGFESVKQELLDYFGAIGK